MNDSTALMPLADTMQLGEVLAKSGFFEDSRQAAQAVVKVLAGRELGIGPVASMTGIHIIKGKPSIGANVMAGVIKNSRRYTYRVRQMDASICVLEFFERTGDKWESLGVSSMTLAEAKQAGTQNLERFPRNMLFARAISNGARWYCPDLFGGAPVYTPEELGAPVDEDGEVINGAVRVVEQPKQEPAQPKNGNGKTATPPAAPADDFEQMQLAQQVTLITDAQRKAIFALANQVYGKEHMEEQFRPWLAQNYRTDSTKNLTIAQASEVIDLLKQAIVEQPTA